MAAQPLDYTPPKARTEQTAEEEWAEVLETLHETETLRTLHGLVGRQEGIEEVVLTQLLGTERGHAAVKNLAALFNGFSDLDAGDLEAVQEGVGKGLKAARRSFEEEKPPGLIRLFARLRDPDVRRALAALLALLKGVGGHLNEEMDGASPKE